ncbi:hypothetical protein T12_3108 [Trichinella patagoniensis]|uniref:Uncharacterized protein n=1 Tax=Trichinella patagoniensis TaxID=990121 RepID=A0A0V1AD38_9BILA|nr:hypothetical protein T12_3108 [Trichinella patagoniensis]
MKFCNFREIFFTSEINTSSDCVFAEIYAKNHTVNRLTMGDCILYELCKRKRVSFRVYALACNTS